ncbi:MAG: hypothetical protein EAZ97_07970 [Bacteroidetes bacterium]|nr:MAG: hypothetical protein EAZ97_07970 [Bacteroidota bacterium]
MNKEYTTKIDYPIVFVFDQSKIVSLIKLPKSIEIDVTGQGWALLKQSLNIDVEPLYVKIKTPTKASFLTPKAILPLLIGAVPKLKVVNIPQDTIWFQFNFLQEKRIFVYLNSEEINLQKGYFLTSPILLNPQYIKFKGASSLIENMGDTLFLKLSDSQINNKNYTAQIDILSENSLVPNFPNVSVSFNTDLFVEKSIETPIILKQFPTDSSVYLKESRAIVSYWVKERYKMIDNLRVVAKFEDLNLNDSTIIPQIDSVENFRNVRIEPPLFKVIYAKKHHKNRNYRGNWNR